MIPKRIHYCWFSGDPYPSSVQACIDSWHQFLPGYEFVLWDYARVSQINSVWLQECLAEHKWAFAADFVRLYAIYHEGGIYLDSDVKIYGSFDRFLSDRMFIGREGVYYTTFDDGIQVFLTSHCFGAEAGHAFLKLNLDYYQGRHFIQSTADSVPNILKFDMLMMPFIQSKLAEFHGYDPSLIANHIQLLQNDVTVYPDVYFGYCDNEPVPSDCYARHLGQASWREKEYFAQRARIMDNNRPITFSYKVRWRIVRIIRYCATKLGYIMVKVVRDGFE